LPKPICRPTAVVKLFRKRYRFRHVVSTGALMVASAHSISRHYGSVPRQEIGYFEYERDTAVAFIDQRATKTDKGEAIWGRLDSLYVYFLRRSDWLL
jgi:hypothetical protein